jgi:ribosomal 50S subunit-recycling heat shock protein
MRLDKFLKVSRLIKRRTVAKEICEGEKVCVNGKTAKPSSAVKPGDRLVINMRQRILEVIVLSTPDNVRAEEAHTLYEIVKDTKSS